MRESRHVAYRKAHLIEERALLDPPAKGLCEAFLALGIERAGSPQFFTASVPLDAVAMTNFDGRGKFTQVGVNVVNGVVPPGPTDPETGFGIDESGSYIVFPDCTGNFELDLPGPISISARPPRKRLLSA